MNLKNYLIKYRIEWLNGKTSFKYEKYNFSLSFFPYIYQLILLKKVLHTNVDGGSFNRKYDVFKKNFY